MPHTLTSLLPDVTHVAVTLGTLLLPGCSHEHPLKQPPSRERLRRTPVTPDLYGDWLTSRRMGSDMECLTPGAQRPLTPQNIALAYTLLRSCTPEILSCLWDMHPYRITLMVSMDLVRGVLPAFRGYSQAVMVDELQKAIVSGNFTIAHLLCQTALELARMAGEAALDYLASSNENIVQTSARFLVERKQMEHRLRLDVPTLSDPHIRDLLQESDIFVRSFNGFSAFGLFSPFDFMRLISLLSELFTHIWVLSSLTFGGTPIHVIILSVTLSALPAVLSWIAGERNSWINPSSHLEARISAKQEAMRRLAHSDVYRPEIMLFDLGPWILRTWSRARKALLGLERRQSGCDVGFTSRLLSRVYLSGTFSAFQNIPLLLVLHSTSTTVGTFTLYRNTLQGLFVTAEALVHTLRMTFQGVFLMGAFCAATTLRPRLQPEASRTVPYQHSGMGMAIDVRNLCFTYPGGSSPALKHVNLSINPGEALAIVGYNGSGKSTLANVLLRILDFDSGELLVNGVDIRHLQPRDFHAHVSAVFQGFSRFSTTVKANVGLGYVPDMSSVEAVDTALELAGAGDLVRSLPDGVRTRLDGDGSDRSYEAFCGDGSCRSKLHGLSGGEWQRIAISRAFMRARRPEVELLLFDEPTSSLDAHAQKHVFDTIEQITRPNGDRTKTVIFITHRLATARRADKIAMMESGTVVEFGTHEELLGLGGKYAALYRASV
ncbi:P-loop containing nucleoside triphosphate hydrolase protein [Lentinus tigrinus ALCF2SS1-7]|uniref:P-loop containing nucleoside triphosphate hydrolase protein n=1 Tax=Lentinus tigrinus ALCF2SS1-6 TaxID=1328759 RepID=A0A5C2SVH3_9APHY|nr:P-loop containing nucleoside triphosphate hydrolase protein [Lentinus tigrinus ALCF2SS1-6]RPD81019.1 P-loop containing nucleoside triphosphate hydrolase protein [Lentinus tigrinus ALCF2SS1-7]